MTRILAGWESPKILHICGSTDPLVGMMNECGADALSFDIKNNLVETRKKVGDDVIILGNYDVFKLPCAEETTPAADDRMRHFGLFIENLRARKQPNTTPQTLQDATTIGHLMNISWEVGRSIRWDAARQGVVDDPKADGMVMKPYRAPWKLEV
ncbi:MAG: hypothetical protein GY953_07450 [bacterium]|nr:hypothetical protein [bacterium]